MKRIIYFGLLGLFLAMGNIYWYEWQFWAILVMTAVYTTSLKQDK